MYLLSLETSGKICGVALSKHSELLSVYTIYEPHFHDAMLSELVNRTLKDFSLLPENLSAIAISSGPGSFTGLRIGAALGKALCFNQNIKLISVPTMSAFANAFSLSGLNINNKNILVAIPSHKDLHYVSTYNANVKQLTDIQIINEAELKDLFNKDFVCIGPSFYIQSQNSHLNYYCQHNAKFIFQSGLKMYSENNFNDADSFVPLYSQDFEPSKSSKILNL